MTKLKHVDLTMLSSFYTRCSENMNVLLNDSLRDKDIFSFPFSSTLNHHLPTMNNKHRDKRSQNSSNQMKQVSIKGIRKQELINSY